MDEILANRLHEAAVRRAQEEDATLPKALEARYEPSVGLILVKLSTGGVFGFAPDQAEQTQGATPDQLHTIEITPSGFGLYFPQIDGDVLLTSLMQGRWGSKHWMAAQIGKLGGASRSLAKSAAARANGQKGGRPKKPASST